MMAGTEVSYEIRQAVAADKPQLLRLYAELQAYECALHPNRAAPDEITETHWAFLEDLVVKQDGKIWVAESSGGEILGFLLALVEDGEPYLIKPDRRYGYVSDIAVSEKMRGKGIGQALMDTAEIHFRKLGLSQMCVGVMCANKAGRDFYMSGGFRPYEMTYEKRLDDLSLPEVTL